MARTVGSRNAIPRIEERHLRAAYLLVERWTEERVAEDVGVSVPAVAKWKTKDWFQALVKRFRLAQIERAVNEITAGAVDSATAIVDIATGKANADARTRLDAAKWVIESSAEYLDYHQATEPAAPRELHEHIHFDGMSTDDLIALARSLGGAGQGRIGSPGSDTRPA